MLTHLKIQNYALIKALDIDFQSGYTSITGETGAGKSILLGAIGLVMGDRGDSSAILNPSQKCVIEAEFSIEKMQLSQAFEARDLDYSNHCTVRREWHPNGKTRSFINDTPVMVAELKWLGNQLLEIHSQHTGLLVTQAEEQLKLLDAFAGTETLLSTYKMALSDVQQLKALLKEKRALLAQIQRDSDYHQYLLNELQDFNPVSGEEIDIEQEINLLSQSEQLSYALSKSSALLNGDDGSLLDLTSKIKSELKGFVGLGKDLSEFYERINQVSIEAKELSRDIEGAIHNHESNPQRLDILNQRFSALQQLLKKHGCTEAAELIQKRTSLEATHAGKTLWKKKLSRCRKVYTPPTPKWSNLPMNCMSSVPNKKMPCRSKSLPICINWKCPSPKWRFNWSNKRLIQKRETAKSPCCLVQTKDKRPCPLKKLHRVVKFLG